MKRLLFVLLVFSTAAVLGADLTYEVEDWTTPRDAWLTNKISETKWRLWTTEGPGKRSRDASIVSPVIKHDRATPEEGAPVLHTHITGIPQGLYRAFLGSTTRPIAYSLDGAKTWLKNSSGETDLGIFDIKDGTFDLWADDRFANPSNIGSTYYDCIRLVAYVPPKLSGLTAFKLPNGDTQISWISNEPAPAAVVECNGREFKETETDMRNHRVALTGLEAGKTYTARVRLPASESVVEFAAGKRDRPWHSKQEVIELTIQEPTTQSRVNWPVTSGVPFAQGVLADAGDARLFDSNEQPVAVQCEATSFWPDGSVKWLLVTFPARVDAEHPSTHYSLQIDPKPQPQPATVLTVRDTAEAITIENGELSLRVSKDDRFALFENVARAGSTVTSEPLAGNGSIVDASGKIYGLGRPDVVEVEERGPVRAVVRVEGDFIAEDGSKSFRWRARYFVHVSQPWVRLSWTIGNNNTNDDLTNLQSAGIRIPFATRGPMLGSLEAESFKPIKDDESTWLLQDKDDRFTSSVNGEKRSGTRAAGIASIVNEKHRVTAFIKDFWQSYPKGFAIKPDGLHVQVLPPLPPDAFAKESENTEDLIRLYYCYKNGQYRIKRGLEFTTDIFVRFDAPLAKIREDTWAEWLHQPLFAAASPKHYCASGVFGLVEPRQRGLFDSYEQQVEAGFSKMETNREQKHEFGWMNYGDWHGERHFNWGNLEYDMMGALALQFVRTGDLKYLWRADQCSRHSTDIDTIHYPWQTAMTGRVYAHSVGHVGGFFDMTDERFQKRGNVFGLREVNRPNPFVGGAIDPGGHIFQPGNFRLGFLTGERRYLEVAEMVCAAQAAFMTTKFDFGIERAAGWPLMNAVAAYEATGNPFFLNAARLYVEKIVSKQTERGDWGLQHGPPECLHTPPHPGGKAFATGILLNGLVMFDAIEPSEAVKRCIVRAAHWLEQYSWNHETHSFRYIDTCPTYDKGTGNGSTDFIVSSGLAYASMLDDDPALQSLLLDSLSRAVGSGVSVGKDYTMDIRQTPQALAILHQKLGITELAAVKKPPGK